jgi:hypothetical protein
LFVTSWLPPCWIGLLLGCFKVNPSKLL